MTQEVEKALSVIKEMARQVVANLETHSALQSAIQTVEAELSKPKDDETKVAA